MAAKNQKLRKRLIADLQVQGALAVRVVIYWMSCLFVIGMLVLLWRMVAKPLSPFDQHLRDLWSLYEPAAVLSISLLPVVVLDMLKLTNRFAGPLFRLRRAMRDLAQGKPVEKIQFRKGDFWQDFASDFNVVAARLGHAESDSAGHYEDRLDGVDEPEPVGSAAS
jgi:hypothetical protein